MQNTLDQLSQTAIRLLINEPFYGHIFSGLLKEGTAQTTSISTTPAGKQAIKLLVNPEYWEQTPATLQAGAIKHQLLHLIFGHHLKFAQYRHRRIFDVAADLVVNQYLKPEQIPRDTIQQNMLADLGFEQGAGLDEVYQKILAISRKNSTSPILDWLKKDHLYFRQHDSWTAFGQISTLEQQLLENALHETIIHSFSRLKSSAFEKLPAGLKIFLQDLQAIREPQVNWQRTLRLFAESKRFSALKNTIHRPSKRYGTTPGLKIRSRRKLLVAIDTSASVKEDEIQLFFDEIYHLWKRGAEIYIVECDTQIHKQYVYKGQPAPTITGRGGTDFNAAIRFANEQYHPDGLLYFTDGQGDKPEVTSRQPMLWLISNNRLSADPKQWEGFQGQIIPI